MSRFVIHKLESVDNESGFGWIKCDSSYHSDGVIKKIPDNGVSNKGKIGTSIPTPLARIELFRTAFEIVEVAIRDNQLNDTDESYKRLVSDCLDLLQFIFEKGKAEGFKVETWNINKEIGALESSRGAGCNLLGKSLKAAFGRENFKGVNDTYNKFKTIEEVHLFSYNGITLGASSPYTIVYTSPNLWNNIKKAVREKTFDDNDLISNDGRRLFDEAGTPCLVRDRSDIFRTYLKSLVAILQEDNEFRSFLSKQLGGRDENFKENFTTRLFVPIKNINVNKTPLYYDNSPVDTSKSGLVMEPTATFFHQIPGYERFKIQQDGQTVFLAPLVLCQEKGMEFIYLKDYWSRDTAVPARPAKNITERNIPTNGTQAVSQHIFPFVGINDFLEGSIINLDYDIDDEKFACCSSKYVKNINGKKSRLLLPVKKEYFMFFTLADLKNQMEISGGNEDEHVVVKLRIPIRGNGSKNDSIEFERIYTENGRYPILKYESDRNLALGVGVFPFYRISEDKNIPSKDEPKNQYIIQVAQSFNKSKEAATLKTKNILFFTFNGTPVNKHLTVNSNNTEGYGVNFVKKRTTDSDKDGYSTSTYYHLQSYAESNRFDLIEVQFSGDEDYKMLIIPQWGDEIDINLGSKNYIFAVDFGTSNTHIAFSSSGGANPESLRIENQVAYLAKNVFNDQESSGVDTLYSSKFLREFIIENCVYPIKTASLESLEFKNKKDGKVNLFSDINIGYKIENEIFEIKEPYRYETDLKWAYQQNRGDGNAMKRVKAYLMQSVWMLKNQLIMDGGMKDAQIIYFTPSSMIDTVRKSFQNAWTEAIDTVMYGFRWEKDDHGRYKNLEEINEAVAPWYSLQKAGTQIIESDNILNIDIGGGTTDIFYFKCDDPSNKFGYIASSMFAGNDIWGNGIRKSDGIENGFVKFAMNEMEGKVPNKFRQFFDNCKKFSSADASSMLFRYDKELPYSVHLEDNQDIRCILLVHYASILYYICDLLNKYELFIPDYISFTGKGSEYIKLFAIDTERIEKITRAILKTYFNKDHEKIERLKIIRVPYPKELTANGGVQHKQTISKSKFEWYEGNPIFTSGTGREKDPKKYRNSDVVNDLDLENAVLSNFNQFISKLYNNDLLQSALSGTGISFAENESLSIKKWNEKAEKSFKQAKIWFKEQTSNEQNAFIDSTPFFLTLKDAIFQMSQSIIKKS